MHMNWVLGTVKSCHILFQSGRRWRCLYSYSKWNNENILWQNHCSPEEVDHLILAAVEAERNLCFFHKQDLMV